MEPSEIRRRVLHAVEQAKRGAALHREESERATRGFQDVLPRATALWKQVVNVLRADGHLFTIQTPAGVLRFASERSADDFVEMALDTARRPPAVVVRTRLARGHRVVDRESVAVEGNAIGDLDEERLLSLLLSEIGPFVER